MLGTLLGILVTVVVVAVIAWAGTRLLGVRRSWVDVAVSGVVGWLVGHGAALAAADGDPSAPGYVRNTLIVALLATMTVAVTLDLLARPGTLARGEKAGLVTRPRPAAAIRQRLEPLGRLRQVARIARRNGLGPHIGFRRGTAADLTPVQVRRTLEECGGMFVKLGQVLSTRGDLLPAEYCAELAKLQSGVTPAPEAEMRALLATELGRPVEEVFDTFSWTPIASASIAHAYGARLRSGADVIVKVQRPGVDDLVRRDSAVLLRLARLAQDRTPFGQDVRILDQVQEFVAGLREELDFRIEGRNTADIGPVAARDGVRVPHTFGEYTTRRVMVQERLVGESVADTERLARLVPDRQEAADQLLRCELHQMLDHGHYHADPHPGNVFLLETGELALLDWGATGRLDPLQQSAILQMMVGAGLRDTTVLRQGIEAICTIPPELGPDDLERALHQFLVTHVTAGAGVSGSAFQDLLQILGQYQIVVPKEMTSLVRALVTLEGTLGVMSPGYALGDAALRLARDRVPVPDSPDPAMPPDDLLQKELIALLPTLRELPRRLDRVAGLAERGELRTKVSLLGTEADRRATTLLVNRVVLGVIATGTGVASALLIGSGEGPVFTGDVEVAELLGYVGLVASAVLGLRVVAAVVRDGLN